MTRARRVKRVSGKKLYLTANVGPLPIKTRVMTTAMWLPLLELTTDFWCNNFLLFEHYYILLINRKMKYVYLCSTATFIDSRVEVLQFVSSQRYVEDSYVNLGIK